MAHPKVVEFYGKLYSVRDVAARSRPGSITEFIASRKGVTARPIADLIASRKGVTARPNDNAGTATESINLDDEEEAMASYGYQ
jgi:hypothetical protein